MDEHEELVNSYVQNGNRFKFFKRGKSGNPFHFENMCKAEFKYEGMSILAFSRFLHHLKGVFKSFSMMFRT